MEKVTLTKEQAHEFESFEALRGSLEEWARDKNDPNAVHSIIHDLTFDEMARAYLIGYEIEPEKPKFKVGDKVIVNWNNGAKIHTINAMTDEGLCVDDIPIYKESAKLATPEEIYWLETLGRDKVGDFREDDIYITQKDDPFLVGSDVFVERAEDWYYENDDFKGIYPAESFKPFPQDE